MRTTALWIGIAAISLIGCSGPEPRPAQAARPASSPSIVTKDPVCGKEVTQPPALFVDEGGQRFSLCSEACRTRFLQDPHGLGQAAFDKDCGCPRGMQGCPCGHCAGTFEPCPCGP